MAEPISTGITIIQHIVSIIQGLKSQSKIERHDYYNNFILPVYSRSTQIHNDYIRSFSNLLAIACSKNIPTIDLINVLENDQRTLNYLRQDTRNLSREIKIMEQEKNLDEISRAKIAFAQAVLDYFSATPAGRHISWYTSFIETMRWYSIKEIAPWEDRYYAIELPGKGPVIYFIGLLRETIEKNLPTRWNNISTTHAYLKSLLLK